MKLVLASGNKGKHREFAAFFAPGGALGDHGVELLSAADFDGARDVMASVDENGASYEENALIKASAIADFLSMPALADDSGIEVQAMGMRPGIHSARAVPGSDEDRVAWMLKEMEGVEDAARRRAWFVACLVIAFPTSSSDLPGEKRYFAAEARRGGRIAREPAGSGGFGYDPIFIPDGWDVTYAQIAPEEKAAISHRAAAVESLARIMPDVLKYYEARKKICGGAL